MIYLHQGGPSFQNLALHGNFTANDVGVCGVASGLFVAVAGCHLEVDIDTMTEFAEFGWTRSGE